MSGKILLHDVVDATVECEMGAGPGKGVEVKAVPGGLILPDERYLFSLVALFPLAVGYITIVSIIPHRLFTFVWDMRIQPCSPMSLEKRVKSTIAYAMSYALHRSRKEIPFL